MRRFICGDNEYYELIFIGYIWEDIFVTSTILCREIGLLIVCVCNLL